MPYFDPRRSSLALKPRYLPHFRRQAKLADMIFLATMVYVVVVVVLLVGLGLVLVMVVRIVPLKKKFA